MTDSIRPPIKDLLSSIPGIFGIRLEEEPAYEVIEKINNVEIRRYQPARLAQVTVSGAHEDAVNEGFTRLARYIYGANHADQIMEMTSPVYQEEDGEPMLMTSPVSQSSDGDGWTIAFFMTNDVTTPPEPVPDDPSISLIEHPEMVVASLRYTGNNTATRRDEAKQQLLDTLATQTRWSAVEAVSWAQYDQPFAIPFLKRNEAHVAVEETH